MKNLFLFILLAGSTFVGELIGGEVKDQFEKRYPNEVLNEIIGSGEVASDIRDWINNGVVSFGIEDSGLGPGVPGFVFVVSEGGYCEYWGSKYSQHSGHRIGRVLPAAFHRVGYLIGKLGYFELEDIYSCSLNDHRSVYLMAKTGEQEKYILNNGCSPLELQLVEKLIVELQGSVDWEEEAEH